MVDFKSIGATPTISLLISPSLSLLLLSRVPPYFPFSLPSSLIKSSAKTSVLVQVLSLNRTELVHVGYKKYPF